MKKRRHECGEGGRGKQAYLVDIAKNGFLNVLVLDDLTQNASVAATDDQYLLRVRVGVHGQVSNHLLIGKLVALGALDDVVQNENVAVVGRLKNEDILILALLMVENLLDPQSHSLA